MTRLSALLVMSLIVGCGGTSRTTRASSAAPAAAAQPEQRGAPGAGPDGGAAPGLEIPPPPPPPPPHAVTGAGPAGVTQDDGLPPPPPPPPPPTKPLSAPSVALEAQRVRGSTNIAPDEHVRQAMARAGQTRLETVVKMCLADTGKVDSARVVRSSGYPAYDTDLEKTIEATWLYRPFMVNGHAVPVCSAVTIVYTRRP